MEQAKAVTAKGRQTREHILETAVRLFAAEGYEATTMRDIARSAGCSLGLAYRYFESKEDLALALYSRLAVDLEAQVNALPPSCMADRFEDAMRAKLALVEPYRDALGALLGAALTPQSGVAVLGDRTRDVRRQVEGIFRTVVAGATNAPDEATSVQQLATVLYTAHLGILLYWLHDRSPDRQATNDLLRIVHDLLQLTAPALAASWGADALDGMYQVLAPVIGSER